ncbi:LuxR C-terminal-related transcriptional regulator [Actinomycetospora sp. CA-101289]|uniref:helix-turn-helix transcriptional regulator n=1 Tax=Actinomycetospora sp. CA-101289 TaxID=3239893 RepID=UPI003D97C59C
MADLVPGALVLRAAGVEPEVHLALSGLHRLLLPLAPGIAEVAPHHRPALTVALGLEEGPAAERTVLVDAVLALLRHAARERPVLLLVDDLDRLDPASAAVLDDLGRHLAGSRIGLLATVARPERGVPDVPAAGATARGPDEEVARALQDAATGSLCGGDAVGAVALARRAADVTPPGPGRRRRVARAASLAAEVTGDLQPARDLLGEDPRCLDVALATARLLLHGDGDVDAAHRLLVRALETDTAADDDTVGEALHTLSTVCAVAARPELWAVPRRGTPATPSATSRDDADPRRVVRAALAASEVDGVDDHRDALWRVVRDGRAGGAAVSGNQALLVLAFDARDRGRWDEAVDLASEALAWCRERGYPLLAAPARLCPALVAAARGDGAAVVALTDELIGWGAPRGARQPVVDAGWARTLAALGRGDFEEAYQAAVEVNPPGVLDREAGHVPGMAMDLVEAAVRTRRHGEAAAHVAVLCDAAAAGGSPRLALHAAGAAAMAAPQDRAGDLYDAALALPGVDYSPFDLARVRLAHGEHLRRTRATRAAREQLARALEVFEALGARPWAARATVELRAAGRDPSPAPDGLLPPGRASLTAQEREVAGLAASGLTNREIADRLRLSRRTVDAHLYRAFPKLHITGRAALRDALERHPG